MLPSLTAADIANSVRMMRTRHKGAIVLVEGTDDVRVYGGFVDLTLCKVVPGYGRARTLESLAILEGAGVNGIVALIDSDLDRIHDTLPAGENVIATDGHDLETQIVSSPALEK